MTTALISIVLGIIVLSLAYGFYRTWKTGRDPLHTVFISGTVPTAMPEGPWNGSAPELGEVSWKGKKFLGDGKGINVFGSEKKEAYPFTFFVADSIVMSDMKVIQLDYDQKENPLWLRFIVDEMVETEQGKFLGAVYIKLIPGFPFRMGYFRLER